MDLDALKRKLRELKKLEISIRFGENSSAVSKKLVWDEFFSTKDESSNSVKYNLGVLEHMDKHSLKEVYEEYFYQVYYRKYTENGLLFRDIYDPKLLSVLGLPAYAGFDDIKARFRELAKKYHPDLGGDSSKMIELLDAYHKLADKKM